MNEMVPIIPTEQALNPVAHTAPVETGLQIKLEQERIFESSDFNALEKKSSELRGMHEVQQGLEGSIIGAGLQVMVDRYGADKFLEAMQSYDANGQRAGTLQDVIQRLAPEKGEQKVLYDAIKSDPMDALAERFNQTLGGSSRGIPEVGSMERFRRFEMFSVENKRDGWIRRGRNTGGYTNDSGLLMSGDFDDLLKNHPDLVENFYESEDTLGLLKGIRDIYETEYTQFSADFEQAKAFVEGRVDSGEAIITELQTLSDDIFTGEIIELEVRLASAGSPEAQELIQDMLDKKADEITSSREGLKTRMDEVRAKVLDELGASRIYGLEIAAPDRVEPTYRSEVIKTI